MQLFYDLIDRFRAVPVYVWQRKFSSLGELWVNFCLVGSMEHLHDTGFCRGDNALKSRTVCLLCRLLPCRWCGFVWFKEQQHIVPIEQDLETTKDVVTDYTLVITVWLIHLTNGKVTDFITTDFDCTGGVQ